MKKMIIVVIAAAFLFIGVSVSEAVCEQVGYVIEVRSYAHTYPEARFQGLHQIFLKPFAKLPDKVFLFNTPDDALASMASDAIASSARVVIQGNAAACPEATGILFGGVVNSIREIKW